MPKVAISADFLQALSRIPHAQQKKARSFITRFQLNPTAASINYEPIHDCLDDRVRTVRIDLAYRAIVLHPDRGDTYVLVWVDHHDEAMAWARNKRFEVNPVTGALQVLDTELLEDAAAFASSRAAAAEEAPKALEEYALFETFADADLLRTGLPAPLLPAVRALQTPDDLDALHQYLPEEAYEALFWIANLGYSVDQAIAETSAAVPTEPVDTTDVEAALARPDTQRRFAVIESAEELTEILNAPLEKWRVFLHPSQAKTVRRHFNGPARVLGGAGTGKTVVAMHRARYLARHVFTDPGDRILFTTFTRNLADNIQENLANLCGPEMARIEVTNLHRWAAQFMNSQGIHFDIATNEEIDDYWQTAVRIADTLGLSETFYRTEWAQVIQALDVDDRRAYFRASRRGRGVGLNRAQRAAIWPVFEEFRRLLAENNRWEWVDLVQQTRRYLANQGDILPYRAIIVDETQDLAPQELRLLRQMAPPGPNDLFFVGDAHQRIYGRPLIMSHCGIEIRGRAAKLRINYRTTEEIRNWSMGVLTGLSVDDLDGGMDSHREYVSLMHGIQPAVQQYASREEEIEALVEAIKDLLTETPAESICLIAKTHRQLRNHYLPALGNAGIDFLYLDANIHEYAGSGIRVATMHRVKGLEFPHIFIAGVNQGVIPYIPNATQLDPIERDEAELRERCLLHVAASRARDTLTVTSYGTSSPFLAKIATE